MKIYQDNGEKETLQKINTGRILASPIGATRTHVLGWNNTMPTNLLLMFLCLDI